MNADRIFNMILRRLLRRVFKLGMNSGTGRIPGKRNRKGRRKPPRRGY